LNYAKDHLPHALISSLFFAITLTPVNLMATEALMDADNLGISMYEAILNSFLHGSVIFFVLPVAQHWSGSFERWFNPNKGYALQDYLAGKIKIPDMVSFRQMRRALDTKYIWVGTAMDGIFFTSIPVFASFVKNVENRKKYGEFASPQSVYESMPKAVQDVALSFLLAYGFRRMSVARINKIERQQQERMAGSGHRVGPDGERTFSEETLFDSPEEAYNRIKKPGDKDIFVLNAERDAFAREYENRTPEQVFPAEIMERFGMHEIPRDRPLNDVEMSNVQKIYRQSMMDYHPDRLQDGGGAGSRSHTMSQMFNSAWELIKAYQPFLKFMQTYQR